MGFVISNVYTRTGDAGTTGLGDGSRVSKVNSRIEAYATVDEANSQIGMVMEFGELNWEAKLMLQSIQNKLFNVGADLSTPLTTESQFRIKQEDVDALEGYIDGFNAHLEPLRSFVLPGGSKDSALLHVARVVVRRAERDTWRAAEEYELNLLTAKYLNRLSDLLFVMGRYYADKEILWEKER
jgi:cob(I)alamin adenosyltransferase